MTTEKKHLVYAVIVQQVKGKRMASRKQGLPASLW